MAHEQRNSYRMQSALGKQSALIRYRRKECVVRLVDQSSGGFAVASDELAAIKVGAQLKLRTSGGWSEAVVVRKETAGEETVLGLARVCDLPDPRQTADVGPSLALVRPRFQRPLAASLLGMLLTLLMGVVVTFWLATFGIAWLAGPEENSGNRRDLQTLLDQAWDGVQPSRQNRR